MKKTWLNDKLKLRVKEIFEPRYGRELNDDEVVEIANNLVCFVEDYLKFEWRLQHGKPADR